jgi:hypothetical protein
METNILSDYVGDDAAKYVLGIYGLYRTDINCRVMYDSLYSIMAITVEEIENEIRGMA